MKHSVNKKLNYKYMHVAATPRIPNRYFNIIHFESTYIITLAAASVIEWPWSFRFSGFFWLSQV
jgi:hypothetical protein